MASGLSPSLCGVDLFHCCSHSTKPVKDLAPLHFHAVFRDTAGCLRENAAANQAPPSSFKLLNSQGPLAGLTPPSHHPYPQAAMSKVEAEAIETVEVRGSRVEHCGR